MREFSPFDWGCLGLQFVLLLGMIVRELRKPVGKNLLLILVSVASLSLVQMQALWMFTKFPSLSGRLVHLNQNISFQGVEYANLLATFFVICFCAAAYRMDTGKGKRRNGGAEGPRETAATYVIAAAWVLAAGAALTALAGGIQMALENPGKSVAGQTVLLMLVALGKVPLARRLALRLPFGALDIGLYALTFVLLLINSRFLAAYAVLQLAIVIHYRRKEASTAVILGLGAVLLAIFIVFGLYREAAFARTYVRGYSTTDFIERSISSGQAYDWFYSSNVEGFSGLAGIVTYEQDRGRLDHDYGLSNLMLITQLLPNNVRTDPDLPFKKISDELLDVYPYHASVVPSGPEAAYAHFGAAGLILLGLALGFLVGYFHRILTEQAQASVTVSLVSVHLLSLVREMLWTATFFALGEVFIVWCYNRILDLTAAGRPILAAVPEKRLP